MWQGDMELPREDTGHASTFVGEQNVHNNAANINTGGAEVGQVAFIVGFAACLDI